MSGSGPGCPEAVVAVRGIIVYHVRGNRFSEVRKESVMLEKGVRNRKEEAVTLEKSASAVGSGLLDVYATPSMIALMEGCCHESVGPFLEEGTGTVGISLNIKHVAATPVGMKVYCESELTEVKGRVLTFRVEVYDEKGLIGEGIHERCIVQNDKFQKKADAKLGV